MGAGKHADGYHDDHRYHIMGIEYLLAGVEKSPLFPALTDNWGQAFLTEHNYRLS